MDKKTAFILAGQGSQYVGMGKELYQNNAASRVVFDQADQELGYSLSELCFNGPKEELNKTEHTQPAILTVAVAAARALIDQGIRPDMTAGFSLGEYAALVLSGVLPFEAAVKLVRNRGRYMQEAVPQGVGGMAAVLGLETSGVEEACRAAEDHGIVRIANYNCPGQVVISGENKALKAASDRAMALGAKRVIPLEVSGPFHTILLEPAARKLAQELEGIAFSDPLIPVISNVTADYMADKSSVKELLPQQVMRSVLWEMSFRRMLADRVDTFVELGPGSVLKGFARKIDKNVKVLNVEDPASLEAAVKYFHSSERI